MGNSVIRKLSHCCACNNGGSHDRVTDVMPLHPALEFVGHSFSYVRPDPTSVSSGSKVHSLSDSSSSSAKMTTFRSISGASLGSNLTTLPLGTSPVADRPANLESSELVASLSLQPVPPGSTYCWSSGPVEGGFLTGPVDKFQRSLSDGGGFKTKNNKTLSLMSSFKRAISDKMLKVFVSDKELSSSDTERSNENLLAKTSGSLSFDDDHGDKNDDINDDDDDHHCSMKSQNLQWAQGKAGEDRIHLVVSEEKGWIFAGIYDGFSGADAPDHLVANLFNAVFEELKGLLSNTDKSESGEENCGKCELMGSETNSSTKSFKHSDVLKALSVALNKTEETYHQVADSKPQLHIIGSCVLVMLMNGEDVYLMNVGDSRAILAQKSGSITNNNSQIEPPLVSRQLTKDHNADVEEEVERIRKEHPDDEDAVFNDRVKGYLRVTRAFGCGFLKKPKWNDAIFAIFRINYVGTSPYITSSPSLRHYKLSPKDKFLILSSDGLYEHFTNQQVVSEVEWFTATFPDRDPAKHLIEEVLIRAAKKHGLKFHELVKIPPGKRRLYHDDVSVIIISLEGRIWRSSANTNNTQLVA
ncbi:hypothetical protein PTKIN_Ptkin06aG0024700 [Pterospermum kingtungense]